MPSDKNYTIKEPVSIAEINAYRESKWAELIDAVMELEAGSTLPVTFNQFNDARQARNAVRDRANALLSHLAPDEIVRTKLVEVEEDQFDLFFIRMKKGVHFR